MGILKLPTVVLGCIKKSEQQPHSCNYTFGRWPDYQRGNPASTHA